MQAFSRPAETTISWGLPQPDRRAPRARSAAARQNPRPLGRGGFTSLFIGTQEIMTTTCQDLWLSELEDQASPFVLSFLMSEFQAYRTKRLYQSIGLTR